MSVHQAVSILTFELAGVGAGFACHLFEREVEVSGWQLWLLVALSSHGHLLSDLHARFDENSHAGLLFLNSTAIKSEHLLFVADCLARTVVHFFKSNIDADADVCSGLRRRLAQSTVGSAEVTALNLEVRSKDLSQICAKVKEGVRLKEELVENLIAVLLILISTTMDAIRATDAQSQTFIAILVIDGAVLLVREDLICLADSVELGQVESHLTWVLQWVILQSILLEPIINIKVSLENYRLTQY